MESGRGSPTPPSGPAGGRDEFLGTMRGGFLPRLLGRTSQAFGVTDLAGRLVYANPAFEALVGYTTDEVRGHSFLEFTPEHDHATSREALARLRETGVAQRYEKSYRRRDGSLVPVEMFVDLYLDDADQPAGYYGFITDITERRATAAALAESEARHRRHLDEAPIGFYEMDFDGRLTSVNATMCRMLGRREADMIGRPIFEFMRPDQVEESRAFVRDRTASGPDVLKVDRVFLTEAGDERTMAIENRVILDGDGRPTGLRSTADDVTELRRSRASLVAAERKSRALFEGIGDAVFVHDESGKILAANQAACLRLGYTREEFLTLHTSDIDDPEFAAGFADRLKDQLKEGRLSCEGRHRTKDGRLIPVDINTTSIQLEDRPAILAVIRDITERKSLEETRRQFLLAQTRAAKVLEAKNRELERSEARYRRLTEGSLDAVVVAGEDGNITLFNPAAERAFGYPADEAIGRSLTMLMPSNLRGAHSDGFGRYIRTRDPRVVGKTVELTGRRKDGTEFPMELSLSAIELPDGLQFVGSIRDQTERQRMREVLAQSERLASIGLLSAGVAHEINNPLAYIGNNLAVLERDLVGVLDLVAAYEAAAPRIEAEAPEVLERVRAIEEDLDWSYVRENLGRMLTRTRDGVQRVANIVGNLRGLARTAPPTMEPAPLSDLVHQALDIAGPRIRRNQIELVVDTPPLPKLPCVAPQINQVILNLLINAIQAIEESGREGPGHLHISTGRGPGYQELAIRDDGPGIPAEHLPKLFDPFFTTKPVGEGTGLGLSISHGIIAGHGGRIEVESEPGVGSTFRIILPCTAAASPPIAAPAAAPDAVGAID